MLKKQILASAPMVMLVATAFGQTANTVTGATYTLPAPINAAPGQILNLVVVGVGASLTGRVAAPSFPLPYTLAGISVQLVQAEAPQTVRVPLLAVRPVTTCAVVESSPCGRYAVVTVQIPYELYVPCEPGVSVCPSATPVLATTFPQLIVSENGVPGGATDLNPQLDQVHTATSCDLDTAATAPCIPVPIVTHADGSLVTAASPAKVGEEVVIYALGLGLTNPPAQTGQAAATPALVPVNLLGVEYNYSINAPPYRGIPAPFAACAIGVTCPVPPAYAGLTSGAAGLYQINVVLPPSDNIFRCGLGVTSNLTINIVGTASFDGAAICVAPPGN